jgi:hypothetical protein
LDDRASSSIRIRICACQGDEIEEETQDLGRSRRYATIRPGGRIESFQGGKATDGHQDLVVVGDVQDIWGMLDPASCDGGAPRASDADQPGWSLDHPQIQT